MPSGLPKSKGSCHNIAAGGGQTGTNANRRLVSHELAQVFAKSPNSAVVSGQTNLGSANRKKSYGKGNITAKGAGQSHTIEVSGQYSRFQSKGLLPSKQLAPYN